MSLLRGGSVDFDVRVQQLSSSGGAASQLLLQRGLSNNATNTADANSDDSFGNSAFMMFLTVIVVLVVACYIVCIWHMMRLWLCRRANDNEPPHALVMSGRVFDLTPRQRRAVLEAIFSETSKAVTEKDVACSKEKRKKRRKDDKRSDRLDGDIPMNVEVPTLSTANTFASASEEGEGSGRDPEAGVVMTQEPDVPLFPSEYGDSEDLQPEMNRVPTGGGPDGWMVSHRDGQFIIETNGTRSPQVLLSPPTLAPQNNCEEDDHHHYTSTALQPPTAANADTDARSTLPFRVREVDGDQEIPSPINRRYPVDLAVPDLREDPYVALAPCRSDESPGGGGGGVEESKEEEKSEDDAEEETFSRNSSMALLSEPITFTRVESIGSAYTSEFDDETEDNVCPICLNSYHEGDTLIASKHCSHLFHKDCILEWLEKHDSCPVCRVDMVTEGEMNKAATSIVGRTRMYVAVEAIHHARSSPRHYVQNSQHTMAHNQPHHVLPAHRHIIAAQRTPPASPYRASRTMGYASR